MRLGVAVGLGVAGDDGLSKGLGEGEGVVFDDEEGVSVDDGKGEGDSEGSTKLDINGAKGFGASKKGMKVTLPKW